MELLLNLAGVLVAVAMVCLWLRWAPRAGVDRRTQLVALALLILILFPVISVTDDLLAAQNPAETDSCVRRITRTVVAANLPICSRAARTRSGGASLRVPALCVGKRVPVLIVNSPALAPIENRPPPTA